MSCGSWLHLHLDRLSPTLLVEAYHSLICVFFSAPPLVVFHVVVYLTEPLPAGADHVKLAFFDKSMHAPCFLSLSHAETAASSAPSKRAKGRPLLANTSRHCCYSVRRRRARSTFYQTCVRWPRSRFATKKIKPCKKEAGVVYFTVEELRLPSNTSRALQQALTINTTYYSRRERELRLSCLPRVIKLRSTAGEHRRLVQHKPWS